MQWAGGVAAGILYPGARDSHFVVADRHHGWTPGLSVQGRMEQETPPPAQQRPIAVLRYLGDEGGANVAVSVCGHVLGTPDGRPVQRRRVGGGGGGK